jgi:hypothetical protein
MGLRFTNTWWVSMPSFEWILAGFLHYTCVCVDVHSWLTFSVREYKGGAVVGTAEKPSSWVHVRVCTRIKAGTSFPSVNTQSQWAMVWKAWNKKWSASKRTVESTIKTYHPVPATDQTSRIFMAKWANKWVTASFYSDKDKKNALMLSSSAQTVLYCF